MNKSGLFTKRYTHIFFDLDNTLWDFKRNSRGAMLETFDIFNLNSRVDFDLFFNVYTKNNHELWDLYRKNGIVKKDLIRLRFQNTFDELDIPGINPEEMNTAYLDVMPNQRLLNKGANELLNYLKSKKYQLFIITNGFKEVQYKKLENSGLLPFFKKIFISEEIKTPKPARGIFEYAIKSANAIKSKSIMIGDDWETDIIGAVSFGIDAIYYLNDGDIDFGPLENGHNFQGKVFNTGSLQQLQLCF